MAVNALFQFQGVRIRRGHQVLLDKLHLQIAPHRWTCIVGPNGVGKSSLLRAMAGLLPVEGVLQFEGQLQPVGHQKGRAQRLAWLGQTDADDGEWPVAEMAMLGRLVQRQAWQMASPQDHAVVKEVLQSLSLLDLQHTPLAELSAGQRQRARLARLLCTQAPTLLLDEPVTHLDAPHQADWLAWAKEWVRQGNHLVTVLHELPLAIEADELVVLHQGRCLHQGPPNQAATREAIEEAFDRRIQWVRHGQQWLSAWR